MGEGNCPRGYKVRREDGFIADLLTGALLLGFDGKPVSEPKKEPLSLPHAIVSPSPPLASPSPPPSPFFPISLQIAPFGLLGVPAGYSVGLDGFLLCPSGAPAYGPDQRDSPEGHRLSAASGVAGVPYGFKANVNGFLVSKEDGEMLRGGAKERREGGKAAEAISRHAPGGRWRGEREDSASTQKPNLQPPLTRRWCGPCLLHMLPPPQTRNRSPPHRSPLRSPSHPRSPQPPIPQASARCN